MCRSAPCSASLSMGLGLAALTHRPPPRPVPPLPRCGRGKVGTAPPEPSPAPGGGGAGGGGARVAEAGIRRARITPPGRGGRITRGDVIAAREQPAAPPTFAPPPKVETRPEPDSE